MKSPKLHKTIKRVIGFFLIFIIAYSGLSMIFSAVVFSVLFHRVDSLDAYVEIAYPLAGSGYGRERISFDSNGNTLRGYLYDGDGGSTVGLQQSKRDLLAAIAYAKTDGRTSGLPVYLYGHSLGGYAVAAALDEADVRAAVCVSGFDSPVQTMHGKAKEYAGIFADIQYPFLCRQNRFTFGSDADDTAVESINSVDTPILICYGENDDTIPYELSLRSHADEITNSNASFLGVGGKYRGGHSNMWLSGESARYMSELQDELNDLNDVYDGEIPQNVLDDFYGGIDAKKATQLDPDFMNRVLEFMD